MARRRAVIVMEFCVRTPRFYFGSALSLLLVLAGCGAPGEPVPPRRRVPVAISDLAARQLGESVVLKFSVPRKTIDDEILAQPPALEIYRGFAPTGTSLKKVTSRLVYSISPSSVNTYLSGGQIEFTDAIGPAEFHAHAGEQALYVVRTRVAAKRASADSNAVIIRLLPVAVPLVDVRAIVTESAVELSWSAAAGSSFGGAPPEIAGYRVYRAEVDAPSATSPDLQNIKLKAPLAPLEFTPGPTYRDTQIQFGRTYLYSVRTVSSSDSIAAESADSSPVIVTPRDIFPPARPQNLVALFVPPAPNGPAHIELSWGISAETDLAGYHVYRSEPEGARDRLTRELLVAPTFRDMSAVSGHRYVYDVTALDRAGNESAPSEPAVIEVPKQDP